MSAIAIITARGGSKRIPRKNIKEFCGKPIIAYSIEAAIGSGIFDEVMVSTDDEEISQIALGYGAKVPFLRSEKLSGDYATTSDVLFEVLDEYEKRGQSFDIGCCIYPTAPFITSDKLKEAGTRFRESDADSLIPVVPFSYPPQRCFVISDDKLNFKYPEYLNTRSQDLEKEYHDAGQFYFFRTKNFRKSGNLLLGNVIPMVVDEMEVQDIDNLTDWQIAELKYKLMADKTGI
ncbi:N-acylneuraminate cytidylyltransferase [Butyrivibrio fibrisolvens DSM 3071]|uniref:N-acylneuraminate cytidylyltransferase n=1 Tax=Butyrivibrio fibrisolvens DSM 3071 TaxID=1121131 RepID=A0A1M5XWH2_BUTFI|nr:pseudaminic acid cytidylyltransferase [Butyrivibrio fibrisolvens]SHI04039.1 N-acylneuraminate cytidylyltransferase [Butyrivibrio fibrisolvens DSM 3071]